MINAQAVRLLVKAGLTALFLCTYFKNKMFLFVNLLSFFNLLFIIFIKKIKNKRMLDHFHRL